MKFLKQLLLTTMLATLLATPCAAELSGGLGITVTASTSGEHSDMTLATARDTPARTVTSASLWAGTMESTVRPTPSIIEAGYRVGCWIGTKANKPLIVRCATANEEPQHRIEYYYLHLTDMDSNAIKIILNDHATHLTVVTYLGEYASLLLTQDLVSALPTTYMDTMLIDKFVPEVHKGNEQIISIETPYLARAVDGRVVTITYVNPGLTVGDICEVAAGSIGNQLLLSQRTAVQVCAENAPTVEAVADHADAIEVDDDPSDTVPETDTDEVVPEPNTTNHNGTVPNA